MSSEPDVDQDYRARGHGPGERPTDWPADQEWPPRGPHPHPDPTSDHDASAAQAELRRLLGETESQ